MDTQERTEKSPRRCVHCGAAGSAVTKDHVFPSSWYPESTPTAVQRWTVPSCSACNRSLGKMEDELFVRLAICVGPERAEAAGLSARAVRSMGIDVEGLSDDERAHRKALKEKVLKSARRYKVGMEEHTLPGLGPHQGFPDDEQIAIDVPEYLLEAVAEKIVRGAEYFLVKRLVDKTYRVRIYFVRENNVPAELVRAFEGQAAQTEHLGPGFKVTRVAVHDDELSVFYRIEIWGSIIVYGVIMPRVDSEQ